MLYPLLSDTSRGIVGGVGVVHDAALQQHHRPGSSWSGEDDTCWPHVEAEPDGHANRPAR
jgi:hypothetical protein